MFSTLMIIIVPFIIFLFLIYRLTKEDFVILRKSIQVEDIFNFVFLLGIFSLFSARVFYVLLYGDKSWINPFIFLLITHFKGLSLIGAVIGGTIFSYLYLRSKKLPVGYIFDFVVVSFLASVFFGSLINMFFLKKPYFPFVLIFPLLSLVLAIISCILYYKVRLKDGSIGVLSLILFTAVLFLNNHAIRKVSLTLGREDYVLIPLFLIFIILFIKEEKLWLKIKR